MAGLIGFAAGIVATPSENYPDLRAEFRVVQLLTFTVISQCCSPGVHIALKPRREYVDAGHQAWHFIESTYQVTDDLYIGQLEEQMTQLRMGDQETATDYYNRARRLLATMSMSDVQYSTASYVTHVLKGLLSSYNLMKRMSLVPSTREMLNEDSLTSYILRVEAMQEAERSMELLPQVNYAALAVTGSNSQSKLVVDRDSVGSLVVVEAVVAAAVEDKGSDVDDMLAIVHIDLCRPFRVAAKDGSLYFLLLKDRKTRYVWVRPVAKNSDVLQEFVQCLAQGDRPRPHLPIHPAAKRHGGAGDGDGGGVGVDDAAAHGCAAPLVAPCSAVGRLGPQLPLEVDAAAGDDAVPAAHQEEARLVAGTGVGLHGAVPGPRAATWWEAQAEGKVGP
ncbi:unnamed protein product [Closterium sp. NIES-54]